MNSFLYYDNDGGCTMLPALTEENYNFARRGKATLFQIKWDDQSLLIFNTKRVQEGCWEHVQNDPTEPGLYMVAHDGQPFDITRVAVWTGDHWRTPQVGRIDGDNRIGHVDKWKGPLKC